MISLAATTAATSTAAQSTPQPRLVHAAHEFEAQMAKELMKPMTSGDGLGGEDDDSTGSNNALGQFASDALGRSLSEHGGFGIANSIVRQLTPVGNKGVTSQVTALLHSNTVMSGSK
jgi:Rod binding domain-containing protein